MNSYTRIGLGLLILLVIVLLIPVDMPDWAFVLLLILAVIGYFLYCFGKDIKNE